VTRVFESSTQAGHSTWLAQHPKHVRARKREHEFQVRFTPSACIVQSPEGEVHARPGDAILTGTSGEQWRVSRADFAGKYRPAARTAPNQDGSYLSMPIEVMALQLSEPFAVVLSDGHSRLSVGDGDWLVDYGDGSFGIVSGAIFPATYEILD
jgi:hypothetical protein